MNNLIGLKSKSQTCTYKLFGMIDGKLTGTSGDIVNNQRKFG